MKAINSNCRQLLEFYNNKWNYWIPVNCKAYRILLINTTVQECLDNFSIEGVHLEALAFELCGTIVRNVDPNGAISRDGRLRTGDLVLYLNNESLWRVTSSQAKSILRRAEFVSTGIP